MATITQQTLRNIRNSDEMSGSQPERSSKCNLRENGTGKNDKDTSEEKPSITTTRSFSRSDEIMTLNDETTEPRRFSYQHEYPDYNCDEFTAEKSG